MRTGTWIVMLSLVFCAVAAAADENVDYYKEGIRLFEEKSFEGALEQFQKADSVLPNEPLIYSWVGACLNALGRYAEAEERLETAFELLREEQALAVEQGAFPRPIDIGYFALLAGTQVSLGKYEKAVQTFQGYELADDGSEEAALMTRGITAGRPLEEGTLLVDIGGGSTELVLVGSAGPASSTSLDVGCVRVTERFLVSDPPAPEELAGAAAYVRSVLPALEVRSAIGVAGTVTTLATLDRGDAEYDPERTHGHQIARASVEMQLQRLAALTVEERLRVPGLEPGRAPVIVAGIVVLREIMDAYGLDEIEVSERDILHGAAYAAAELSEPEEGAAPPGAYTCC